MVLSGCTAEAEARAGGFDLVVEAYTIQPLYGPVRDLGHDAVASSPGAGCAGGRAAVASIVIEKYLDRRGVAPGSGGGPYVPLATPERPSRAGERIMLR